MTNKLIQLHKYVNNGWSIIPLRPGEKGPMNNDWTSARIGSAEVEGAFVKGNENVGLILGAPSGFVVDADLETQEVIRAAKWFMPDTGAVFGRESKRRSHLLYKMPDSRIKRSLFKDPIDGTLLLEIRGDGHQTMLPGSVHPSGEEVFWEAEGDPVEVAVDPLLSSAGMTAAVAFFARHWSSWNSAHHAMILHLSGGLLRAGWTDTQVEYFITAICTVAQDHEPNDRVEAVRSTVKRYEQGDEITGWPSLSEYLPELVLDQLRSWLGIQRATSNFPNTEEGNALRMAHYFGDTIRWCPQWNAWLIWDDRHWRVDDCDRIVNIMRETLAKMWEEVASEPDPERKEKLAKWILASQSASRMFNAPKIARTLPDLIIHSEQLNADPYLINVQNGTLNLVTGGLQPFNKEDYITKLANVRYEPHKKPYEWLSFLETVLPDPETRAFVQRAVGYSITGDISEQVFFMLIGEGGNGKSTFMNVINGILGDYNTNADITTFVQGADRVRSDLARLQGSRLVSSTEPEEDQRLAVALIKKITGGDAIVSRFLYGREFQHVATYKIWIITNFALKVKGSDAALWRRIKLVPFVTKIPKEDRVKGLEQILLQNRNSILNWMVEGTQEWMRHGLGEAKQVEERTEEYHATTDTVMMFVEAEVEKVEGGRASSSQLYNHYKEWCMENGHRYLNSNQFKGRMQSMGFEASRTKSGVIWHGIELPSVDLHLIETPEMKAAVASPFTKEKLS